MRKLILLGIIGLAGCPSTAATTVKKTTTVQRGCPNPSDCTVNNGPRLTGVVVDDTPESVTSIRLRSGETFRFK
jgi:hypothetical protein